MHTKTAYPSMAVRISTALLTLVFAMPALCGVVEAQVAPANPAAPSATPAAGTPAESATGPQTATPPIATPNAGNTIRVNARLVVLDMVVVDRQGNPVTNLTRDDFHVQEDSADQTVQNFEVPGHFTPAPDVTIESTADLDRLAPRAPVNIILLDEFNTRFEDMAFARYSLKKFLDKQPGKLDTPTMLVSVSLQKFEVLRDYTQNKDEILTALDHHFSAYPWQAQNYQWVGERYATAFITLQRVAEASIGHPGHKSMIWIGRGLPNVARTRFSSVDRDNVNNAEQRAINELRDARVTLYTIDPAGLLVNPGVYGEDAALFDPFGGQPDFQELARATGGRNLYGRNDVDAEIGTSIRDGSSFYTLTYRPTNPVRDIHHFRKISIAVPSRPDLKVFTRQGYFDSRAPARLTPDNNPSRRLATELAAAESSTMVYDGIPLTLEAAEVPNKYRLHVGARGIVWTNATATDPRMAKFIVTVTTFDKKAKVVKINARAITVKAGGDVAPTGRLERAVTLDYLVPPDSKAVRARFVVRVDATGRMGTADVDLLHPATVTSQGTPQPSAN